MERRGATGSEIDGLLRGALSDIEELAEEDGLNDELDAVKEEVLQERQADFEDLLKEYPIEVSDNIIFYEENIPDAGDPHQPVNGLLPQPVGVEVNDYPHENETLFNRLTSNEKKWRKQRDIKRWRNVTDYDYFPPLESEVDVPQPPDHVLLPKQYFFIFVDRDIIGNVVYQNNLYSVQKTGVSIRTTVSEIERFIGIHMIGTIEQLLRCHPIGCIRVKALAMLQ